MSANKFIYYRVIEGCYDGLTWEPVDWHECNSRGWIADKKARELLRYNLKAYRESGAGSYRVSGKRELREGTA
tara:strand:+ start:485 stop:703 length:219 start_codon:yes stop_codon:yes gene_type:complete